MINHTSREPSWNNGDPIGNRTRYPLGLTLGHKRHINQCLQGCKACFTFELSGTLRHYFGTFSVGKCRQLYLSGFCVGCLWLRQNCRQLPTNTDWTHAVSGYQHRACPVQIAWRWQCARSSAVAFVDIKKAAMPKHLPLDVRLLAEGDEKKRAQEQPA